jgi:hypothetical protein
LIKCIAALSGKALAGTAGMAKRCVALLSGPAAACGCSARPARFVVGDHHKGSALVTRQAQHQLEHRVGGAAVEVAGGLVGQHAGRLAGQRTGDGHTLAFTARQLRRVRAHTRAFRPTCLSMASACARAAATGMAAYAQRHGHVVQRAELGQQVVELVDEAQVLVAPQALFGRAHAGEVAPHQPHRARGRRVQPAQQVQQRALARARRAHHGQRLAALDAHAHAAQHAHVQRIGAAALPQSACAGPPLAAPGHS